MDSTSFWKDLIQIVLTDLYRNERLAIFCQLELSRVGVDKVIHSCARLRSELHSSPLTSFLGLGGQLSGHHSAGTCESLNLERPKVGPDTPSHLSMR